MDKFPAAAPRDERTRWLVALAHAAGGLIAHVHSSCIAAVLLDTRMTTFHGREGVPRALGSVAGGMVARFLRPGFQGRCVQAVALHQQYFAGAAVTPDGKNASSVRRELLVPSARV
jgi:hypothetical protein